MKLFITGISGLLGLNAALEAVRRYPVSGCYWRHPVTPPGVSTYRLDVREAGGIEAVLGRVRPDVILHTVGMSNVDACESDPGLAQELNFDTAQAIARVARRLEAKLVYISTDHLFDGVSAWKGETDPIAPLNVYAKTKGEAEQAVLAECPQALVIRTNFYGWGTTLRISFSDWILNGLAADRELRMFRDVFFTPILINDLVEAVLDLVAGGASGLYHLAGAERVSKYEFAVEAARVFGYRSDRIRSISVDEPGLRAIRPKDMSLSSLKAVATLGRTTAKVTAGLERLRGLRAAGWLKTLQEAVDRGSGRERDGF